MAVAHRKWRSRGGASPRSLERAVPAGQGSNMVVGCFAWRTASFAEATSSRRAITNTSVLARRLPTVRLWRFHEDKFLADSPHLPKVSQLIRYCFACSMLAEGAAKMRARDTTTRSASTTIYPARDRVDVVQSWYSTAYTWSKSLQTFYALLISSKSTSLCSRQLMAGPHLHQPQQ